MYFGKLLEFTETCRVPAAHVRLNQFHCFAFPEISSLSILTKDTELVKDNSQLLTQLSTFFNVMSNALHYCHSEFYEYKFDIKLFIFNCHVLLSSLPTLSTGKKSFETVVFTS